MSNEPPMSPSPGATSQYANRSKARLVVFQVLFQEDLNPGYLEQFGQKYLEEELPRHEQILLFAQSLLNDYRTHQKEIDARISQIAKNWTLVRINVTDRNILRLGVCELLYQTTPKAVVIHEALELAGQFGTKDSAAFVNGILDQILP
ncbi:MAG: transcription antitermination factor NusB [Planctomycetaceae bacterium]|nr:transcription antitermination factor NusB [Planctomycetaceae bacterium]